MLLLVDLYALFAMLVIACVALFCAVIVADIFTSIILFAIAGISFTMGVAIITTAIQRRMKR